MTAATPMIMPSIVSAVRILLRPSALNAMRNTMKNDIPPPYQAARKRPPARPFSAVLLYRCFRDRWQRRKLILRMPAARDRPVGHDQSVAERDRPRAVLGDVHFMRDQDDRDTALPVQPLEDAHDFDAGLRVEV